MENFCFPFKAKSTSQATVELVDITSAAPATHEPTAKSSNKLSHLITGSECIKREWFIPVFLCASFHLFECDSKHIEFKEGRKKAIRSILVVLLIIISILFQILFFSIFFVDLCIYRPILFIKIQNELNHTESLYQNYLDNNSSTFMSPSRKLFREYEDWFLFIWDYLYGLIGLYSTAFLFLHSWTIPTDGYPGVINLIRNIMRNKLDIFLASSSTHPLKPLNLCRSFYRFVTCSGARTEKWISELFYGMAYSFVIISSIILVLYWLALNATGRYFNPESGIILSQDSNAFLFFIFIDSFHWHLAPVIICFLVRFSCMEIYTGIDKLRISCARKIIASANQCESTVELDNTWRDFYNILDKVSVISFRYGRICAINITILVFSVLAISLHYIDQEIVAIDRFIRYDWIDASRFLVWYLVHLISVWFMVDAMATLNSTITLFADEILITIAKDSSIELSTGIRKQLNLCRLAKKRFGIHFYGVVNRATVHVILASGGTTFLIFAFEALKIFFDVIRIP